MCWNNETTTKIVCDTLDRSARLKYHEMNVTFEVCFLVLKYIHAVTLKDSYSKLPVSYFV